MSIKYWIYFKDRCDYCLNKGDCKYPEKVKKYIEELDSLDDRGIYGTSSFWCDYYCIDEKKYFKNNNECASQE